MLRVALFTTVLLAGAPFFQSVGLFPKDEAWLVAGLIAAGLLFLIPESGKVRDSNTLVFTLMSVIAIYGIFLKLRPWLTDLIGHGLAAVVSVLLIVAFAGAVLLLPSLKHVSSPTNRAE